MKLISRIAAIIVALGTFAQVFDYVGRSYAAATLLPNAEQCFAAGAATSGGSAGFITGLGSITAGSGYDSGGSAVYANVPLTGGSGAGAVATISVTAGSVTNVVLSNQGSHYVTNDVLSAANGNLGGSGSGFSIPVTSIQGSGTGMIGLLGTITGGAGGTAGLYPNVTLTGGLGTNATANITVTAGAVTQVQILNPGIQYVVGDVLSASSGSIGGVSGFSVPVSSVTINQSLAGGSVYFYVPNTQIFKQTWFNADQASNHQNTNPVTLDSNGCAIIYGIGSYRQILQDSLGNTVWDQITTDTSANNNYFWAGLAAGTPNVITINDPGFNATDGSVIGFTAIATNTGATTIQPIGFATPIAVEKDTTGGPVSLTGTEITQNNPIEVVYRSYDNAFHILNNVIQSATGSSAPLCGAVGYQVLNTSGSPNTELTVTANSAVMVSASGIVINRSNVNVTINFAVNGANGLDTGVIGASTNYYIYLIDNGAAPAGLASLSSTAPTLPTGYNFSCRLSSDFTDSTSHLGQIETQGIETRIAPATAVPAILQNATIAGSCFSSFSALTFAPLPTTAIRAVGALALTGVQKMGLASTTSGTNIFAGITGVANLTSYQYFSVPITTAQTLNYCSSATANILSVYGWDDNTNAH